MRESKLQHCGRHHRLHLALLASLLAHLLVLGGGLLGVPAVEPTWPEGWRSDLAKLGGQTLAVRLVPAVAPLGLQMTQLRSGRTAAQPGWRSSPAAVVRPEPARLVGTSSMDAPESRVSPGLAQVQEDLPWVGQSIVQTHSMPPAERVDVPPAAALGPLTGAMPWVAAQSGASFQAQQQQAALGALQTQQWRALRDGQDIARRQFIAAVQSAWQTVVDDAPAATLACRVRLVSRLALALECTTSSDLAQPPERAAPDAAASLPPALEPQLPPLVAAQLAQFRERLHALGPTPDGMDSGVTLELQSRGVTSAAL
ncbi:MAG: hypothetical protein RIQ60_2313 [Pseudomonadota bacterium]